MNNKGRLPTLNNLLKFLVPLGLGLWLFWYLYGAEFPEIMKRLITVKYSWILLSMGLGVLSHWIRAYRWKLLLLPTGYRPSVGNTLAGLFVGYFANLLLPRFGEIARCLSLKKSDQVPVSIAFGTVITERLLDLIFLGFITLGTLLIEFDRLQGFFHELITTKLKGLNSETFWLIAAILLVALFLAILGWYRYKDRILSSAWGIKILGTLLEVRRGVTSLFRVRQQGRFWLSSLLIWIIYYFMSYVVFFAMDSTCNLGWEAALSLLVAGGVAMSAPVQGGIGAYHYLVSAILIFYGVTRTDGLLFAFILHTSQTLLVVLVGLISLIIVLYIGQSRASSRDHTKSSKDKNI